MIRARSVRRLGEMSRELESGTGSHLPNVGAPRRLKKHVLSDAGISKDQAYEAEKIAAVPEDRFERLVESSVPRNLTLAQEARHAGGV